MRKVAYITVKTPYGTGETFILTEIIALKELGINLLIIPRDKDREMVLEKAKTLINNTLSIPLFNFNIAKEFLKYFFNEPILFFKIMNDIALSARNTKIAFKNLAILPKSLYLCRIFKEKSISHIHAHWGSTTSSMAFIISKITKIPWSFTVHRWDIPENNILREKCKSASFIRAIDKQGKGEIISIIKDISLSKKILVIHMGVCIPKLNKISYDATEIFTILCPANFVPKKGHQYLIKVCKLILDKNIKIKCLFAGDGPLEDKLKTKVNKLNLNDYIEFLGRLNHESIFELYGNYRVNTVILPSIVTEDNEKEGIPVSLMEAMAFGLPVISTDTGGIPELIGDGSGIMIKEKDPEAIANEIEKLANDQVFYMNISERGREKVEREFNISLISKELLKLFLNYSFNKK
jgi:glycosyltransferase involved in cell wall biosynthesis